MYANARSLAKGSKRDELRILFEQNNVDIIGITETWGRDDIMDCDFQFPGFKLFCKDRSEINDKKGGGVALYVRDCLLSLECEELKTMRKLTG